MSEEKRRISFVSWVQGSMLPEFPCLGIWLDGTDVLILTGVLDNFQRQIGMTIEEVKEAISSIIHVSIDEWTVTRDISLQLTELLACISLVEDGKDVHIGMLPRNGTGLRR